MLSLRDMLVKVSSNKGTGKPKKVSYKKKFRLSKHDNWKLVGKRSRRVV